MLLDSMLCWVVVPSCPYCHITSSNLDFGWLISALSWDVWSLEFCNIPKSSVLEYYVIYTISDFVIMSNNLHSYILMQKS